MIKLVGLSLLASVIANVVGDTAATIGALAAGLAGAVYIGAHVVRFLKDLAKLVRRILATYEVLTELREWMPAVDDRLGRLEQTTAATHEPVEAIARDLDIAHRSTPAA